MENFPFQLLTPIRVKEKLIFQPALKGFVQFHLLSKNMAEDEK